ncbi:MAG: flavin oxidoreductase [Sphingobacteriaceae bacterium]|nr:flavin oxidoreductase [Sphingobacteriaceae bacterium]
METQTTQRYFSFVDLMGLEQRYRAAFVNSLSGFKSVALIGTANSSKQTNLAIFNSLIHIGANPPYIGFISRPDSIDRHTLSNIMETGYYTINHINEDIFKQAHQTSARYPRDISEFDATHLTPDYKLGFKAPFVKESHIQLGVQFKERINITTNNTVLVIGQINQVYFPNDCLCNDGFLDIEKAKTITCSGLDSYHKTERLARLTYAKTDRDVSIAKLGYIE